MAPPGDMTMDVISRDAIMGYLDEIESEAKSFDGLDDAIVGIARVACGGEVLVYDEARIIAKLMEDGMDYDCAWEYYAFNIADAYLGTGTPVIMCHVAVEFISP